VRTVLFVNEIT